jgi:putative acetyltransferase
MIATHPEHRGQGVGPALMEAMVELADRWLQLRRLGLIVWASNRSAIGIYERTGFRVEGTLIDYAFTDGAYCNALIMGRIRLG